MRPEELVGLTRPGAAGSRSCCDRQLGLLVRDRWEDIRSCVLCAVASQRDNM